MSSQNQNLYDVPFRNRETIYKYVTMFRATDSVLDNKKTRRRHVLTEEKLAKIGDSLKTSPAQSYLERAQENDVPASSVRNERKL